MVRAYRRGGYRRSDASKERAQDRANAKDEYDHMYKFAGDIFTDLGSLTDYATGMAERAADRGDDEAQEKWDGVAEDTENLEQAAQTFYDEATSALEGIHEKTGWAKPSWAQ